MATNQIRFRLSAIAEKFFKSQAESTGIDTPKLVSTFIDNHLNSDVIKTWKVGDRIQYTEHFASQCIEDIYNEVTYQISIPNQIVGILVKSSNRTQTFFEVTHIFDSKIWQLLLPDNQESVLKQLHDFQIREAYNGVEEYYLDKKLRVGDSLPGKASEYIVIELIDGTRTPATYKLPSGVVVQKVMLPPTAANLSLPEVDRYIYVVTSVMGLTTKNDYNPKTKLAIGRQLDNKGFRKRYGLENDDVTFQTLASQALKTNIFINDEVWKRVGKMWEVAA